MTIENAKVMSPIAGIADTERLGLLGHSFGAAVGLSVIANQCLNFLCREPFTRPKELLAGAFYGANLRDQATNEFIAIQNNGIGVELIQGDRDGVALPERAERTFENIQTSPKALITLSGANHFGITNVNNPAVLVLIQLHQRWFNRLGLRRSHVGVACFCGLACSTIKQQPISWQDHRKLAG